jgi:hypothetical protein
MADIRAKERAIQTLTSTGASLTNSSGGSAGDIDLRTSGGYEGDFQVQMELTCQWATITGITNGTIVADLYLVPKMDGTNTPDVDTTTGASNFPIACLAGSFIASKAPTANTNMRFVTTAFDASPRLSTAYIKNRSGQTISANWTLKAIGDQGKTV